MTPEHEIRAIQALDMWGMLAPEERDKHRAELDTAITSTTREEIREDRDHD